MATSAVDLYFLEKQIGGNAAINLRTAFKKEIQNSVKGKCETLF